MSLKTLELGIPSSLAMARPVRPCARGLATKDVAFELHLSPKTIETYRAHIKEKLGFKDAAEMIRFAVEWVTHRKPD